MRDFGLLESALEDKAPLFSDFHFYYARTLLAGVNSADCGYRLSFLTAAMRYGAALGRAPLLARLLLRQRENW